jgi:hypothetical protein
MGLQPADIERQATLRFRPGRRRTSRLPAVSEGKPFGSQFQSHSQTLDAIEDDRREETTQLTEPPPTSRSWSESQDSMTRGGS